MQFITQQCYSSGTNLLTPNSTLTPALNSSYHFMRTLLFELLHDPLKHVTMQYGLYYGRHREAVNQAITMANSLFVVFTFLVGALVYLPLITSVEVL